MEGGNNNWVPPQGEQRAMSTEASSVDWRSKLLPDARLRVISKIMDILKRHLPMTAPDDLTELKKIAVRFEEKIYSASVSQPDYLRKISLKMLSMENKTQNPGATNSMPPNPAAAAQNSADSASHSMPAQVQNSGQSLPLSLPSQSQTRQQSLPQGLQNNIASSIAQSSANLTSVMPSSSGVSQSMISSIGQTPNLQYMPGISQNLINNGQSIPPNIYGNSQRQMQQRQHQQSIMSQQHQQQMQNSHLYQQQILKAKMNHSSLLQSRVQQQQQSLLQATQMQSSQQPLVQSSSGLHSSQTSLQQTQPSMMQSVSQSGLQQNMLQQSTPVLQQHPTSVVRQQQLSQPSNMHQQASSLQQQPAQIGQQPALALQQQQQSQLLGHQRSIPNMQHNQLHEQQSSVSDMQQQRLISQQNNLLSMQQTQQLLNQQNISAQASLGPQNKFSGLQQQHSQQQRQQQSQLLGSQSSTSNTQQYQHSFQTLQQSPPLPPPSQQQLQQQQQQQSPPQQQLQPLQAQGQQSQSYPMQQQLMSHLQPQTAQFQQQMSMQQQPNTVQRETQQRLPASGALLPSQAAIEQQKPLYQSQKGLQASPNSMDSTAQTGQAGPDWQEEIYQKIKYLKDSYFLELNEMYHKIVLKLQQHDALISPIKNSEQLETLKKFKNLIERLLPIFQVPKSSLQPNIKDKLPVVEKQMITLLNTYRKRIVPSQLPGQQQFQHSGGQTQSMPQQLLSQVSPIQQQNNHINQMTPMSVQGPVTSTSLQSTFISSMQNKSMPLSTHMTVPAAQQSMMNANMGPSQSSASTSLQQGAVGSQQQGGLGPLQQTTASTPQQTDMNILSQTNNALQSNVSPLQPNTNVLQHQYVKQGQQQQQQQQMAQSQQMKLQMQRQMSHVIQAQQKQQQQQQFHPQQKQQQSAQLQVPQLNQMNEVDDLKVRQGSGVKAVLFQAHPSAGQRQAYYQQQLRSSASFPVSSPQIIQPSSPQISQNSSPQLDQMGTVSSLPKTGTPLQSANSPFVVPSPSTPLAPSPITGDHEKQISGMSPLSNGGNLGYWRTSLASTQSQSLAVNTPGISASPLLAEYTGPDGNQGNASTAFPGKISSTEQPLERLLKAVRSSSSKALSSSVGDISSVVGLIDRLAGSAPGNGSRAAVGEDLVAVTKCRLQARNFMSQDGSASTKKMKRHISAMPLNAVPSAGTVNGRCTQSNLETYEWELTTSPRVKRPKVEANYGILEEIRVINQQLIDTVVDITDEDVHSITAAAGDGEGMLVKCSFCAVALSKNLKSQLASSQVFPISPLRLLVPSNYPDCSPVLLDKVPVESRNSKESEDLSMKARSRFSLSLRSLPQPMSLGDMARAWDACARGIIVEYAQQSGGGSFSSSFCHWENCVTA